MANQPRFDLTSIVPEPLTVSAPDGSIHDVLPPALLGAVGVARMEALGAEINQAFVGLAASDTDEAAETEKTAAELESVMARFIAIVVPTLPNPAGIPFLKKLQLIRWYSEAVAPVQQQAPAGKSKAGRSPRRKQP